MKKLLLSAMFACVSVVASESEFQPTSLVFDFIVEPTEVSETWNEITAQTKTVIEAFKAEENNTQEAKTNGVAAALELTQTIAQLTEKANIHGSITCSAYQTDSLTTQETNNKEAVNKLIIRFSTTRFEDKNLETWNELLTLSQAFSDAMNSLEASDTYPAELIKNHITAISEVVKSDNNESLQSNLQISLHSIAE